MLRTKLQRRILARVCLWSFAFLAASGPLDAQEFRHSVTASASWVSVAQIFIDPFSRDPIERNLARQFDGALHPALRYTYTVTPSLRAQLSAEYMHNTVQWSDNIGTPHSDAFTVWGLEAAAQYVLPFTGETFRMFIGGGGGLYDGARRLTVSDAVAESVSSSIAFSILTVIGAEYAVTPFLAVNIELRFRDPVITTENAFDRQQVLSNGVLYPLDTRPFSSKVNINGNVYAAGVAVRF